MEPLPLLDLKERENSRGSNYPEYRMDEKKMKIERTNSREFIENLIEKKATGIHEDSFNLDMGPLLE